MKYLVTRKLQSEHEWANDDMAEEQCSAMRGDVSFCRVTEVVWTYVIMGQEFATREQAIAFADSQLITPRRTEKQI